MSDENGETTVYSVSQINSFVRTQVSRWSPQWVEGEIASWKPWRDIQVYASIKDETAALDLVIPADVVSASPETFSPGDKVRIFGQPDFATTRGAFSFRVSQIQHEGIGDLLIQVEKLRQQLSEEGAFDQAKKVALPYLPLCIGLITSRGSDAEQDIKKNVLDRWSDAKFKEIYTGVSRDLAIKEVPPAIATLDADPEVDVIIIARGGGSPIELLAFSDENIVRAAIKCRTPIISAIGHENDHPLLDDVADVRASTPTDAAKKVVPDVAREITIIGESRQRIRLSVLSLLQSETEKVASLRSRPVLASPHGYIDKLSDDLISIVRHGSTSIERRVEIAGQNLIGLQGQLRTLSPQNTLERGYAIVRDKTGKVVSKVTSVKTGDAITIRVSDGELEATAGDEKVS